MEGRVCPGCDCTSWWLATSWRAAPGKCQQKSEFARAVMRKLLALGYEDALANEVAVVIDISGVLLVFK